MAFLLNKMLKLSQILQRKSLYLPILSNVKKSNDFVIKRCQKYIEKLIIKKI